MLKTKRIRPEIPEEVTMSYVMDRTKRIDEKSIIDSDFDEMNQDFWEIEGQHYGSM